MSTSLLDSNVEAGHTSLWHAVQAVYKNGARWRARKSLVAKSTWIQRVQSEAALAPTLAELGIMIVQATRTHFCRSPRPIAPFFSE